MILKSVKKNWKNLIINSTDISESEYLTNEDSDSILESSGYYPANHLNDIDIESLIFSLSMEQSKILVLKSFGYSSKEIIKELRTTPYIYYKHYSNIRIALKNKKLSE